MPDNYSTAQHRAHDCVLTAHGDSLQSDLYDLQQCEKFMLPALRNMIDLAKHRGIHNGCFDDFMAVAIDHFRDEIGHIENKLSNPWNGEIWGGKS